MGLYKYDNICTLRDLYTHEERFDYARQIERIVHALRGKDNIIIYPGHDFDDSCAIISSITICERDQTIILVLIDDDGHAIIVQDESDADMFSDIDEDYYIGIPNEFNQKLNKVLHKYRTRGSTDFWEMAIRLVELGDAE